MFVRSFTHRRLFPILPVYLAPDDGAGDGTDEGTDEGAEDTGKTFTQAQLDRILQGRTGQAGKAAKRELLEALGVKDEAEAKKIVADAKKVAEANASELDKAKQAAAENETAAQAARREANEARTQLKIDRALLKANARTDRLERASKNVWVDLEDDADDDAIAAAIEALKAETPEWFADNDDQGAPPRKRTGPAPSGTATNGKGPKGPVVTDALTRGRERARLMQGRKPANEA